MKEPYEKGIAIRSASSLAVTVRDPDRGIDHQQSHDNLGPLSRKILCSIPPTCIESFRSESDHETATDPRALTTLGACRRRESARDTHHSSQ